MHILPPFSLKPPLSDLKKRLAQVDEVDGVPVRVGEILVHVLNVPSSPTANVDPDALFLLLAGRHRLGLQVRCEELEHSLAALEKVGARRVVHVSLTSVERIETLLLAPVLVGGEKRLEEAVPDKHERRAQRLREAEDDKRPCQGGERPAEHGRRDFEVRREESLDRPAVSKELEGVMKAYESPVRRTAPLARRATWVGLSIVEMASGVGMNLGEESAVPRSRLVERRKSWWGR